MFPRLANRDRAAPADFYVSKAVQKTAEGDPRPPSGLAVCQTAGLFFPKHFPVIGEVIRIPPPYFLVKGQSRERHLACPFAGRDAQAQPHLTTACAFLESSSKSGPSAPRPARRGRETLCLDSVFWLSDMLSWSYAPGALSGSWRLAMTPRGCAFHRWISRGRRCG